MVLKGVNWVHNIKFRSYGLERSQLGTPMIKFRSNGLERSQLEYIIMIKSGQMVLKGVNRVHNDKIGSNGLERSQ